MALLGGGWSWWPTGGLTPRAHHPLTTVLFVWVLGPLMLLCQSFGPSTGLFGKFYLEIQLLEQCNVSCRSGGPLLGLQIDAPCCRTEVFLPQGKAVWTVTNAHRLARFS